MAKRPVSVDLANRLALRPEEAAAVLGVSLRKLQTMLPRLPHFRDDGVVIIPVDSLRQCITERARASSAPTTPDQGAARSSDGADVAREVLDLLSKAG